LSTKGSVDNEKLRAYLLGRLSEEEQESLEQEMFAGEETFDAVLAIEDELVEAHLDGTLPAADRADFERSVLGRAGGRRDVAVSRSLRHRAKPASVRPRWVIPALTAAALAIAALGLDDLRLRRPGGETWEEAGSTSTATLRLREGAERSEGATPMLVVRRGTQAVRLEIELPGRPDGPLHLALQPLDGGAGLGQGGLAPALDGEASLLRAFVPARRLPPGDYLATVADRAGKPLVEVFFRVAAAD
jgi:hypothetical protein